MCVLSSLAPDLRGVCSGSCADHHQIIARTIASVYVASLESDFSPSDIGYCKLFCFVFVPGINLWLVVCTLVSLITKFLDFLVLFLDLTIMLR